MKQNVYSFINKISLRKQIVILISFTFTFIIIFIIAYSYRNNRNTLEEQQINSSAALLHLEAANIDAYFSEISRYSLLLRHDKEFMRSIDSHQPLDYTQKTNIQNLLRSSFDSRGDLLSYRLYLLQKQENYSIDSKQRMVLPFTVTDVTTLADYDIFTKGKYYRSILPAAGEDSFITFTRTIIRIEDRTPLAIAELSLDTSFIASIAANHEDLQESFCLLDEQNRILYTNNTAIDASVMDKAQALMVDKGEKHFTLLVADTPHLTVYNKSEKYGFTIFSFKPVTLLEKQLASTRNISFILAAAAIIAATLLVSFFTRLVTTPLSTLSHRLRKAGSGNFTTTAHIGGSLEIVNLSTDFNFMIRHIDDLIKKNYIAELNTKTAQLIALEAQVNPHFLYNTLQAISAEAIINQQPKINAMITSLASMLRYSIKEEEFVSVSQEVKHVKDYLSLQESRFGDRLITEVYMDEDTKSLMIPKISIQLLAENSIIHGMDGEIDHLRITIRTFLEPETELLMITVQDNGAGMEARRIVALMEQFKSPHALWEKSSGIGLSNLSSRLHILYETPASITLESIPGKYTLVTLSIPIGGENHVSRPDN